MAGAVQLRIRADPDPEGVGIAPVLCKENARRVIGDLELVESGVED